MKRKAVYILIIVFLSGILYSCNKDWLEAKPDKSLVVPNTIADFQALLDNTTQTFNFTQAVGLGEISAGDFYLTNNSWQSLFTIQEKSAYIWEDTQNFYKGETSFDWVNSYVRVLNANVILDGIKKIKPLPNEEQDWNNVKGSALFFRAFDFFNLSQEYCKVYTKSTAFTDLGLPLRLDYNVNVKIKRSNLNQTYNQIIEDLEAARQLLGTAPQYKTRPSRQAVYGLLARTYLAMEIYDKAGLYADSALQIQSELIDFSHLNENSAYPIERFNKEVIFHNTFTYGIFNASRLIVESSLYDEYDMNDYRRTIFFKSVSGGVTYRGNYTGDKNLFGGLATDEMYLIRAEASARSGVLNLALIDLNALLKSRWNGMYQDILSNDQNTILSYILKERRKELAFRGLRWSDLRRLNKDSKYVVVLTRVLNGKTYTLSPGDKKYVFPIDEVELRLSGIQQNDR